jgi:polyisoprenoid-binding protein YceI
MTRLIFLLLAIAPMRLAGPLPPVFSAAKGSVHFVSEAPLESIEASSKELKGLIDTDQNSFAFSIDMQSFQGFNSPLQKEHFNENYLETKVYRKATFAGKIIETIDFSKNGSHTLRAKGKLDIHGVSNERIIKCELTIKDGKFSVRSSFTVLLNEHDIAIPKIVHQKIAEEIKVEVDADFEVK